MEKKLKLQETEKNIAIIVLKRLNKSKTMRGTVTGNSENRTWSKASDTNGLQSSMKLLGWKKRTWSSKDGIVLSPTRFTRIYIIRAKRVLSTNSGLIISISSQSEGSPPPSFKKKK